MGCAIFITHKYISVGILDGFYAFVDAEEVEAEDDAVTEADLVARRFLRDRGDFHIREVLRDAARDSLRNQRGRHLAVLAVDIAPFAFVVEFDCSAVHQSHLIVGLLEQVPVDLDHADLGLGEMLAEHFLGLGGELVAVDGVGINEGVGRAHRRKHDNQK